MIFRFSLASGPKLIYSIFYAPLGSPAISSHDRVGPGIVFLGVITVGKRPGKSVSGRLKADGLILTAVLFACFVGAGVAGCLAVSVAGEDGVDTLSAFLRDYLAVLEDGSAVSPSIWSVIWELCRWPALVLLLGFTALGAVAIPAVFCVRGFLLSYALASFVRVFGVTGIFAAFAVFGMAALVSVPVLFCMGAFAFPSSLRLAAGVLGSRQPGLFPKERLFGLIPCGGLLLLAVFVQWSVMPQLLLAAAKLLTAV